MRGLGGGTWVRGRQGVGGEHPPRGGRHNAQVNTPRPDYDVIVVVPPDPVGPAETLYQAQMDGNLCDITGRIMSNTLTTDAYTEADARGVFAPTDNNSRNPTNSPIQLVVREDPPVVKGGLGMARVTMLDPRAANDAVQLLPGASAAPDDGFFTPATYVGAFSADENWLLGWTAADEFGLLVQPPAPAAP